MLWSSGRKWKDNIKMNIKKNRTIGRGLNQSVSAKTQLKTLIDTELTLWFHKMQEIFWLSHREEFCFMKFFKSLAASIMQERIHRTETFDFVTQSIFKCKTSDIAWTNNDKSTFEYRWVFSVCAGKEESEREEKIVMLWTLQVLSPLCV